MRRSTPSRPATLSITVTTSSAVPRSPSAPPSWMTVYSLWAPREHGGVEAEAVAAGSRARSCSWPGLMSPDSMRGIEIGDALERWRSPARCRRRSARTLMRTLSSASPSMMSLPPRPSMTSLPPPPRMMLPPSNEVTPAPRMSCRPSIRAMPSLVSTLPRLPAAWISAASASSPSRMSLKVEPDRPSSWPKRSISRGVGRRHRRLVEGVERQVDGDAQGVVLVGRPSRSRDRLPSGRHRRPPTMMSSPPSPSNSSMPPPPMKTSWPMIGSFRADRSCRRRRAVGGADLDPVVALVADHRPVGRGCRT